MKTPNEWITSVSAKLTPDQMAYAKLYATAYVQYDEDLLKFKSMMRNLEMRVKSYEAVSLCACVLKMQEALRHFQKTCDMLVRMETQIEQKESQQQVKATDAHIRAAIEAREERECREFYNN